MELVANLPKPEGFFDPGGARRGADAARASARGAARARRRRPARRRRRRRGAAASPIPTSPSSAPTSSLATITASTSTTSRTRGRPRLMTSVVVPWGTGRRLGVGTSPLHVRRADARAAGLRPAGCQRHRQQGALPRHPHLRHHRHPQAASGGGRADLPRIAHAHAGAGSRGTRAASSSMARARARCGRARSSRAARARTPRRIRTPRSSASTSSKCRSARRRTRRSSIGRASSWTRARGNLAGLWQGGNHGEGTQTSRMTNQCHDITVYSSIGLAAGACSGNGILLDISDPQNPRRLDHVVDKGFAYWHSATFNNDGTKVVFTDEWGGGSRPRCRATDPPDLGRRRDLRHRRPEAPVPRLLQDAGGRRPSRRTASPTTARSSRCRGATSWCSRGTRAACRCSTSPIRRTRSRSRSSIAARSTARSWSPAGTGPATTTTASSMPPRSRAGMDILRLVPGEHLTQNELDAASLVRWEEFNSQNQPKVTWPTSIVVAARLPRSVEAQQGRHRRPGRARFSRRSISADRVSAPRPGRRRGGHRDDGARGGSGAGCRDGGRARRGAHARDGRNRSRAAPRSCAEPPLAAGHRSQEPALPGAARCRFLIFGCKAALRAAISS